LGCGEKEGESRSLRNTPLKDLVGKDGTPPCKKKSKKKKKVEN